MGRFAAAVIRSTAILTDSIAAIFAVILTRETITSK